MSRTEARALACLFAMAIAWPIVLGLAGVRERAIENRRLVEPPHFSPARLLDHAFYEQLSGYLADHLPLRERIVGTNSRIAISVWRDSPNPEVHIGGAGWLFTTSFRGKCPEEMPLSAADRIAALGRALRSEGLEMKFVLAPNKAAVYPERLGAFPPQDYSCGLERLAELRTRLARSPETGFVDMWSHLARLKDQAAEPLYFPGDSHWTPRGAAEMSRAIVESIEPGLWSEGDIQVTRRIQLPMDLATLIGAPRSVPVSITAARRKGVETRVVETQDCEQGPGCVVRYRSSSTGPRLITRPALLVRDSFGTMAIDTLAPYFADITFLFWSNDLESQIAARKAAADLVIFQTVDHFLWDRVIVRGSPGRRP